MGASELRSRNNLFDLYGGIGKRDIVANRPIKQHTFLENDTQLST